MKVSQLISALQGLPAEAELLIASDPEGNSFHPLVDADPSPYSRRRQEPMHPDDVDEHDADDITEVVILWP